ncbi:hypothetical protein THARTR1_02944 [Trichoderma harzianum]|uniref:Uncharacterized protein n=1 Tax=Trichoderma harzianum TaxID=5544 RepID=A0A2K0UH40_TRIHA|nr:hypothetical protein THARTR1_02944 [Trichoderma harzianum]
MSSSSTKDIFYQDLKAAFIDLIQDVLPDGDINDDFFICPPRRLRMYGCLCDEALTFPHDYTSCDQIGIPYPSIISQSRDDHGRFVVKLCPHLTKDRQSRAHRLFCFKPTESAGIFMDWLIKPRDIMRGFTSLNEAEIRVVMAFVDDYERFFSSDGTSKPEAEKVDVVCRLLVEFRAASISNHARMSHVAGEAERLLELLGWWKLEFDTRLSRLVGAMKKAVQMRLGKKMPTNIFQGERPRRGEDTPPNSFRGEQYRREGERRARSPPRDQYRREESTRWPSPSRAKSRGRHENRWPSPPRAKSRGGNGSRWPSPLREGYEGQLAHPLRGGYEPRSPDPPRGKSRGRVTDPPRGGYEPRLSSPPRGKSRGRVADPPRGRYEPRSPDPPRGKSRGREYMSPDRSVLKEDISPGHSVL